MFSASYPAAILVRAAVRQLTMMQALMSALPAESPVFLKTFFLTLNDLNVFLRSLYPFCTTSCSLTSY